MNKVIFISHSHTDARIAEHLVDFILSVLEIKEEEIRCTSLPGHMLDFGELITEQLRMDVHISTVVFALLTQQSLESPWVLFELGAAWVFGKLLVPVLAPGLSPKDLPPLEGYPCIQIDHENAPRRLMDAIHNTALELNISMNTSARSKRDLDKFVDAFRTYSFAQYPDDIETRTIKFTCTSHEAAKATDVSVAGSFNNWLNADKGKIRPNNFFRLEKIEREGKFVWEKDILIPVGPHDFKFVVGDNYWIHWSEESGYPKGSDAPGGSNFSIVVE